MTLTQKRISVVIPAFNETDVISQLASSLRALFDSLPSYAFEAIIVDNGSTDDTFSRLQQCHAEDSRFKVVSLSKNFKCDGGITAGLR